MFIVVVVYVVVVGVVHGSQGLQYVIIKLIKKYVEICRVNRDCTGVGIFHREVL